MRPGATRGCTAAVGCLLGLIVLGAGRNASGGDAGVAISGTVSGSRLRAMFHDGGGGARLFRGWFDTELRIPCGFVRTRNGQMRCLPVPATAMRDSTCAMPVLATPRSQQACSATPPRYVTAFGIQGVPVSAAYELGEPYAGAVRTSSLGICTDVVRSDWGTYYATGAEVPSERFVAATIRWLPLDGGRRLLRTEEADDGSSRVTMESKDDFALLKSWRAGALPDAFVYLGSGRLRVPTFVGPEGQVVEAPLGGDFFDTQANAPCHPEPFADGERCIPRTGPNSNALPNDTCTMAGDTRWAPVTERVE
jgi:hypothetical protein